jgi:hypothetical protein
MLSRCLDRRARRRSATSAGSISHLVCNQDHGTVATRILDYGRFNKGVAAGLGCALLCGSMQFFWIPVFMIWSLTWDRPKSLFTDSLIHLIAAVPSAAAAALSLRASREYYCIVPRPFGRLLISIIVCTISVSVLGAVAYMWIVHVLLDLNGKWSPI